jgi:hypothetical protein
MKFVKKTMAYGLPLAMVLFMMSGCDNSILKTIEEPPAVTQSSSVAKRIEGLKNAGLLDSLLQNQNSRTITENGLDDLEDADKINYFILNTDEALAEIAEMENGADQVNLITALFTGGTVGEVADAMAAISEDMSTEYLAAIEEQLKVLETGETNIQSRSVTSIRDIRINYLDETSPNSRAIYGDNFNWDTIIWYAGFCVATTAGAYAASSWMPWVKIPGIVALVAGGVSMGVQLSKWYQCSEFKQLTNTIGAIVGPYIFDPKNYNIKDHQAKIEELNKLFNGQTAGKLVTITGLTAGTFVACSFSALGRITVNSVKDFFVKIIKNLKSLTPSWFNVQLNSNAVYILFTIPI